MPNQDFFNAFPPEPAQQNERAPKSRVSADSIVKLVAALISVIPTALAWSGKYTGFSRLLVPAVAIGILLWIAAPRLVSSCRSLVRWAANRRFISREEASLQRLLSRFNRFVDSNDSRALMSVIRGISSNNVDAVERLISCDYIGDWLYCFREQLRCRERTLLGFLGRCREFTAILSRFNRDYVVRAQKELEKGQPVPEHHLNDLEQFREEFLAYLREVEQWAKGIADQAVARLGHNANIWQLAPATNFERVKSFRRVSLQKV